MTSIKIDGITYNVQIVSLTINGEFLYKYAERTLNGDLKSEAIGFFENQSITFQGDNNSGFVELYRTLARMSSGNFNHTIEVVSPLGKYDFVMYPNNLSVELVRYKPSGNSWWGEMTVNFIATAKRSV